MEEAELPVEAVVGTSSGALVGSLWSAGIPAEDIAARLSENTPWSQVRFSRAPWRGLLSLAPVVELLAEWLPERIEQLDRPFAAGVMTRAKEARLLTEGPLASAVAASCSMPFVFEAVDVGGEVMRDGGAVDRLAYDGWRALHGERPVLAHLVARSAGPPSELPDGLPVVHTPRSHAKFWDLGDFAGQMAEAKALAHAVIEAL